MFHYISAWQIHTTNLRQKVREALEASKVEADDVVWVGPSGDAVIAANPADLPEPWEEYADYTDRGQVHEYI